MERTNFTATEFVLLGFHELPSFQLVLFFIFLVIYVVTLVGNSLTIGLFCFDQHFHSPMYILLCNMSVLDMSFTSMVLPKLLDIFLTGNNVISYEGCITQVFFFVVLMVSEYFTLAAMAYDRYVAICHPLHYSYFMSLQVCFWILLTSWSIGVFDGILYAILISSCTFCRSNKVDHLFCDMKPLMMLSCSDTHTIEMLILGPSAIIGFVNSVMTLVSYMYIISTVLKIHSKEGRHKTFSTCSSHLTVILLFYGTVLSMYMRPKSSYSMNQDKVFAILYTGVIPMLNPLIYSLKNQEAKKGLRRLIKQILQ
ncbi:olfactory receptor 5AR1-like [Bufo gargarizans]|uniref:olfactory receptor 5AR1-like n=1 Tax=Bufo gargarizans TaxID=30331 RepID=UPI001CF5A993|nr:olfactory receptor 5AR1-like [Bufo gargarizans]